MTAVILMGLVAPPKEAAAQARELTTVERAELPVYPQMDQTSPVVDTLLRGDLVEIDRAATPEGAAWCRITQIGGKGTSGYVPCDALRQGSPKPSQALQFVEEARRKSTPTATRPKVLSEGRYSIQVASLLLEKNARSLTQRLEKLGYTPDIRKTTGRIMHHQVYVGEFASREEVERTARGLNVDGFPSTVVTLQGDKFTLQAGSFLRLNEAIDLAHNLETKKYTTKIVSEPVPTPVHQVRVGKYENRTEALTALEALKREGFAPLIVRH